jgi:hypothetical protein
MTNLHGGKRAPEALKGISRRQFGKGIGVALAAGGLLLAGGGTALGVTPAPADPLLSLDKATFDALVGQSFRVYTGSGAALDLELADVEDTMPNGALAADGVGPRLVESFSVSFRGPADQPLAQDTYQFEHAQLGACSLFVVPAPPAREPGSGSGSGNDARYYVAAFTRLVS